MDIGLFDNFEEDGQLSLFDMGEDIENLRETREEAEIKPEISRDAESRDVSEKQTSFRDKSDFEEEISEIRIQKCASCGKLLMVRQNEEGYRSFCNTCGIGYLQRP